MKDDIFLKLVKDTDPDYSGGIATTGFIDTGSYIFNAAVSASLYGGFPNNRITALHSLAGVGKTFFAMSAVKAMLDNDEKARALYFDTEYAIDETFLTRRNINKDRVAIQQPDTIEDFKTKSLNFLNGYLALSEEKRVPVIMILDSLGMLPSIKEDEDSSKGKNVRDMTKQQGVRSLFRTATQKLGKAGIPMVVCAHSYTDIMTYGSPQKMSGGGGLEYAASTICALSKTKDQEEITEGKKKIKKHDGNIITVKVDKSRFSREGRKVQTRLSFIDGLDRYYGLLDLAASSGIVKKLSTQYEFPDGSKHYKKHIDNSPATYFNSEMMRKLEEAAKMYFSLGAGDRDFSFVESEDDDIIEVENE